jgi:hypothetical protein
MLMQFPRYELALVSERARVPTTPRPRPRRTRPARRSRRPLVRSAASPPGRLDAQQYLRLEFAIDDR